METKYERVILDFETTGLSAEDDEILQVSVIDQDGKILLNEYCKPKNRSEWKLAEKIHNITPEKVSNKRSFEEYVSILSDILTNTEEIIIYNADFEKGFLYKYGVKFNNNIYDLMYEFAKVYGEWNDYYGSYKWKSLNECCLYYGYYLGDGAHDSLEDCKATLYCYNKLINNEEKYNASEYIGKLLKEFLDETWKKINGRAINLRIYPIGSKFDRYYINKKVISYDDIEYEELLNTKIKEIQYISPRYFYIYVDKFLKGEYDLSQKEIENLKEKNFKLEKEIEE